MAEGTESQQQRLILLVITTENKGKVNPGMPALIADDEVEAEQVSSELGKIFFADVNRLSNGVYVIKTPSR